MSTAQIDAFLTMGLGYCVAGLVVTVFQSILQRRVDFELLYDDWLTRIIAIPMIALAGPVIIMRNTIRKRRFERRKVHIIALATALAGLWSTIVGVKTLSIIHNYFGI